MPTEARRHQDFQEVLRLMLDEVDVRIKGLVLNLFRGTQIARIIDVPIAIEQPDMFYDNQIQSNHQTQDLRAYNHNVDGIHI